MSTYCIRPLLVIGLVLGLLIGCAQSDDADGSTDALTDLQASQDGPALRSTRLVVDAGQDRSAYEGDVVKLKGLVPNHPDPDELVFRWQQTQGPRALIDDVESAVTSFVAPEVESKTIVQFALTVDDGEGSAQDFVGFTIQNRKPPKAIIVVISSPTILSGDVVTLDAGNSIPDGPVEMKFQWFQVSGPTVRLNDSTSAVALFVAPGFLGGVQELIFTVLASQGTRTDSAEVAVQVHGTGLLQPGSGEGTEDDDTVAGPTTLPIDLRGAIPESKTIALTLSTIPAGTSEIELYLTVFDADRPAEGQLTINDARALPLFGETADVSNAEISVTLDPIVTDVGLFREGINTLVFRHDAPTGFVIENIALGFVISATCADSAECDDEIFCNGQETCVNRLCKTGEPPCEIGEQCIEDTANCIPDTADPGPGGGGGTGGLDPPDIEGDGGGENSFGECAIDLDCDDGIFCNGQEECVCSNTADCTDGVCAAGPQPCGGLLCRESTRSCRGGSECETSSDCSDGSFCNGIEQCLGGACFLGTPPCSGLLCDEISDVCSANLSCTTDEDCNDTLFCNGEETCDAEECEGGDFPCGLQEFCLESNDTCSEPQSNVYYVDDDGDQQPDYNPSDPSGSINNPFARLQDAGDVVLPGDTVFVKAGTYYAINDDFLTPVLNITTSGFQQAPIRFLNHQNDVVIVDAEATRSNSNNGHRVGINISPNAHYIEISGLIVKHAFRQGMGVFGDYALVEDCIFEDCGLNPNNAESAGIKFDSSKFLTVRRCVARYCYNGFGARSAEDSLFEDCLAYRNGITSTGDVIFPENANGFQTGVARNGSDRVTFRSCIAWGNADDGWDCSHSRDIMLDGCISFLQNDLNLPDGDGGGYKIGNDQNESDPTRQMRRVLIRNSFAIRNKSNGIDPRDGIDGMFYNNTAYDNFGQFGYSTGGPGHPAWFFNNLSWDNVQSDLFHGDDSKIADYNNWASANGNQVPGGDQNSIHEDPGFANAGATIDASWQGSWPLDDVRGIMPTINNIRNQFLTNFEPTNLDAATTSVDRGTFITFTSGSGSNTSQISVQDDPTRRFRVGDVIQVEGAGTAQITAMTGSTISIDSSLSFAAGAGVHVPWNGDAPDMGAVEAP